MTYYTFITNIIESRGRFNKDTFNTFYERHHIVPRCQGGTNSELNLIDLTPREHYEAHKLLFQEIGGNKLSFALHCTTHTHSGVEISEDELNFVREQISEAFSGKSNPFFGKHHSEGTKKKMSEARKDKYCEENNPMYGKHHSEESRKKISESKKGKPSGNKGKKFSEEHKRHLSESHKGHTPWNKGKTNCYSKEQRQRMSESLKGHTPWNKGKKCQKNTKEN